MQFYDATNKRALCQETDRLCDTTDTNYPRLDKTARANDAIEELVGEIIGKDGTWQYDDTNYTTLPRGIGNLVEGQVQYSFAAEYLDITEIDVLDQNGVYRRLEPLDPTQLEGLSPEEYFGVSAGTIIKSRPLYYDKLGDTIFLYPAPTSTAVTLTSGLRVWFKRTAQLFIPVATTAADTTEPGIPSTFHVVIAYMMALPYCMAYKPARVGLYSQKIQQLKAALFEYYALREKDKRNIMTPKKIKYI